MVIALQDAGHTVHVFDNLSRGHSDTVNPSILTVGDLRSTHDLELFFKNHQFDLVMHFAAYAYVGESVIDPELYYQNNVTGALNLLSVMRRHCIQRLVFSSTCATYGEPDFIPISETHPQRPINPYGRSKMMIEQALKDYADAYSMNSISLRYFNAAGCDPLGRVGERHDPETHLIPLILAEALRLKNGGSPTETKLKVFGNDFSTPDGSCIRDYIHVSDLCRAHMLAAQRLLNNNFIGAEVYNLANGLGYSVFEVINACRDVTGQDINFILEPRRSGDPAVLVGDASLAGAHLGWEPEVTDLHLMIETAWNWIIKQPH